MSPTVRNYLVDQNVIAGAKVRSIGQKLKKEGKKK
jgi:hypothetical protein